MLIASSPASPLPSSALSRNVFVTAICSPAERPEVISTSRSSDLPVVTVRLLKPVGCSHEDHALAANRLECRAGNADVHRLFLDHDARLSRPSQGARSMPCCRSGDHASRARIRIHKRADEYDSSVTALAAVASAGNHHRLAFRDRSRDLPSAPPARPKPRRDRRRYKDRVDRPVSRPMIPRPLCVRSRAR